MRVIQNVKNILNKRSGGEKKKKKRKTEKLNTHYDPKINMKLKKCHFASMCVKTQRTCWYL